MHLFEQKFKKYINEDSDVDPTAGFYDDIFDDSSTYDDDLKKLRESTKDIGLLLNKLSDMNKLAVSVDDESLQVMIKDIMKDVEVVGKYVTKYYDEPFRI